MIFKCTWFFEGMQYQRGRSQSSMVGWTETMYRDFGDSIENALIEMRSSVPLSYLGKRLECLHGIYRCRWVRASAVDTPRLTKIASVPGNKNGFLGAHGEADIQDQIGGGASTAAQVTCAMLVDMVAPPQIPGDKNHHRRWLLRGLHQAMINGNVLNESSPSFTKCLQFFDFIAKGEAPAPPGNAQPAWLMRHADPTVPFVPIGALTADPSSDKRLQLTAPLGILAQGARVIVRGVRNPQGVNRTWTSRSLQAGPPYILGTSKKEVTGLWDSTGTAAPARYSYRSAQQYIVCGLRHRAIGRPFNLTRGSRRGK